MQIKYSKLRMTQGRMVFSLKLNGVYTYDSAVRRHHDSLNPEDLTRLEGASKRVDEGRPDTYVSARMNIISREACHKTLRCSDYTNARRSRYVSRSRGLELSRPSSYSTNDRMLETISVMPLKMWV
jgi:hypothetical protein